MLELAAKSQNIYSIVSLKHAVASYVANKIIDLVASHA